MNVSKTFVKRFKNVLLLAGRRLSKDSGPTDFIIHSEILLDIFQTYKRSTCIIKNNAVLCVAVQKICQNNKLSKVTHHYVSKRKYAITNEKVFKNGVGEGVETKKAQPM